MTEHYQTPGLKKDAFTCPLCGAFSAMKWEHLYSKTSGVNPVSLAFCHRCERHSVWINGNDDYPEKMLYPELLTAPLPNEDLPAECEADYMEAREIANNSPRGAAALLRLCIQKLIVNLGGSDGQINDGIAKLVSNGLSPKIQQALDIVRVVGNNAVHPGELSVHDHPETVQALFGLINMIVDNQISQPKQVASLYSALPKGAIDAVKNRDKKA